MGQVCARSAAAGVVAQPAVQCVVAGCANQDVGTPGAAEAVVATESGEPVRKSIADDLVIELRPNNILKRAKEGITLVVRAIDEIELDRGPVGVAQRVNAGAG
ncbi:MAG: hypothetical protein WEB00_08965 [Dehalococcoidia bacterium]